MPFNLLSLFNIFNLSICLLTDMSLWFNKHQLLLLLLLILLLLLLYFHRHASEYKRHDTMAVVYSSGIVWWVPPAYMETTCDVDLTEFPYDEQTCVIQIGSWTYNYNEVCAALLLVSGTVWGRWGGGGVGRGGLISVLVSFRAFFSLLTSEN